MLLFDSVFLVWERSHISWSQIPCMFGNLKGFDRRVLSVSANPALCNCSRLLSSFVILKQIFCNDVDTLQRHWLTPDMIYAFLCTKYFCEVLLCLALLKLQIWEQKKNNFFNCLQLQAFQNGYNSFIKHWNTGWPLLLVLENFLHLLCYSKREDKQDSNATKTKRIVDI
jgi:hypothetical protein